MFVLYETQKAVNDSGSPVMGAALAVLLVVVLAYAVWAFFDSKK